MSRLLLLAGVRFAGAPVEGEVVIIETPDIPGLLAHPDQLPASPDADDDEFDTSLSVDWTSFGDGTQDSNDTILSHAVIVGPATTTTADRLTGMYRSATPPFTFTAKLAAATINLNANNQFQEAGILIGEATPGKLKLFEMGNATSQNMELRTQDWSTPSTYTGNESNTPVTTGYGMHAPVYLRVVVASSTDVSFWFSFDGLLFTPHPAASVNPGFTVGSVGLVVDAGGSDIEIQAAWDWTRFS